MYAVKTPYTDVKYPTLLLTVTATAKSDLMSAATCSLRYKWLLAVFACQPQIM